MSRTFSSESRLSAVLANPRARALLEKAVPGVANSPMVQNLSSMPVGVLVDRDPAMRVDEQARKQFWEEMAQIDDTTPPRVEAAPIEPRLDYEPDDVAEGSAAVRAAGSGPVHAPFEIAFDGPAHGNPFVDVELTVTFVSPAGSELRVGGFYDGDGRYLVRLLPEETGTWRFTSSSTARSLNGVSSTFEITPSENPGRVRVADQFHFRHADGTRYAPFGTTAYAWTHQGDDLEAQTLASLQASPFNKVRMCVFPKSYLYNTNEPPRYPYARNEDGGWDTTRFDVEYFRHLENRIAQLDAIGVQADLIIFHPYDRWGFADLGRAADDRYVTYLVRRLAAYPNIWWSMANEYDLMWTKSIEDWERLAAVVVDNDHAGHLISIHNCFGFYDYSKPWITHASMQRIDVYRTAENIDAWREEWGKAVVVDECAYEGDLDQGWGNITAEEMVRRCWEGAVRGGYVQHGETYFADDEVIWWAKGGVLKGDSPERIRFLASIVAEAPRGVLDPLPSEWDTPWGGVAGEYVILYFGFNRPRFRTVSLPPGVRYRVEVIDTWNMTIEPVDGTYEGTFTIQLPGRQYVALRLTAAE
ncbi:DUF5605 domain-containing protein [Phytoactinopolyspora endophytica]|uniref:DUF5605 domain-containing protein n=1 Tax=Phytoactinopolyspora endophytica TaxID=1642495 RepID=UPI00101D8EDE|nr:DUF5605 domain-containing protein [Phytoactinopolyspora endophytica]